MTTLVLEFKKIKSDDRTKYSTFYSNPKAKTIINESDIDDVPKKNPLAGRSYIKLPK